MPKDRARRGCDSPTRSASNEAAHRRRARGFTQVHLRRQPDCGQAACGLHIGTAAHLTADVHRVTCTACLGRTADALLAKGGRA